MTLLRLILFVLLINCTATVFATPPVKSTKAHTAPAYNPHNDNDTIVIPFDYKQSALYHAFTFEVIDSVVNILKRDTAVKLTIDGYSFVDEGNDTVCKYLSLNRALFVKEYILGRGVDLSRILTVNGLGKSKSKYNNSDANGKVIYCRAELLLIYPPPPAKIVISDRDLDGIADADDHCPDVYGYAANKGCPNDVIVVPFEPRHTSLANMTYGVLDTVVTMLKQNPNYTIVIEGHAYKTEGTNSVCEQISKERATIAKDYLMSRYIGEKRIAAVKSIGSQRPLNAGRNDDEINRNSRVEITVNRNP